jgi:hypothetical protein
MSSNNVKRIIKTVANLIKDALKGSDMDLSNMLGYQKKYFKEE